MRTIVEPTATDRGYESHPAWVLIGASRVTGNAVLFDSDVRHQHYVVVKLSRAERKRELHHDWIHPRQEFIEVAMSEAQWASFVSSMNSGSGVPATLTFDLSAENPHVPGVPYESRLAESMSEVRTATVDAAAHVQEALAAYKEHKTAGNLRSLEYAIENLPANLEFAGTSLSGHAENVVQRAKADIEAFVTAKAQQLGLKPGEVGSLPELMGGDPEDE